MTALRLYRALALALVLLLVRSPAQLAGADALTPQGDVDFWCHRYAVPCWLMQDMGMRESAMQPNAQNPSGASGLYQFMPATYWSMRYDLNQDTTYAPGLAAAHVWDPEFGDYWDPWSASHVVAWALHQWVAYGNLYYACQWTSFRDIEGVC